MYAPSKSVCWSSWKPQCPCWRAEQLWRPTNLHPCALQRKRKKHGLTWKITMTMTMVEIYWIQIFYRNSMYMVWKRDQEKKSQPSKMKLSFFTFWWTKCKVKWCCQFVTSEFSFFTQERIGRTQNCVRWTRVNIASRLTYVDQN